MIRSRGRTFALKFVTNTSAVAISLSNTARPAAVSISRPMLRLPPDEKSMAGRVSLRIAVSTSAGVIRRRRAGASRGGGRTRPG